MAICKKWGIKNPGGRKSAIDYITSEKRVGENNLVSHVGCNPNIAHLNFEMTRQLASKKDYKNERYAWHMVQSFSPSENLSPEQAHEIGKEFVDKYLKGKYEYVIATHTDRDHIHNHFIINAVSHVDYKRFHSSKGEEKEMMRVNDEVCFEYGLSIVDGIDKGITYKEHMEKDKGMSWKNDLKNRIQICSKKSNSFDEFKSLLNQNDIKISFNKQGFIKYQYKGYYPILGKTLGNSYTEKSIINRIEKFKSPNNKQLSFTFNDKISHKKNVENILKSFISMVKSYDELIEALESFGVEVKQGKHNTFTFKEHSKRGTRDYQLGSNGEFTKESLIKRIKSENKQLEYKEKLSSKDYYKELTNLKKSINILSKKCNDSNEVFNELERQGYVIINNKTISIRQMKFRINILEVSNRIEQINQIKKEGMAINAILNEDNKYKTTLWGYNFDAQIMLDTTNLLLKEGYSKKEFINEGKDLSKLKINLSQNIKKIDENIAKNKKTIKSLKIISKNEDLYKNYLKSNKDLKGYSKFKKEINEYEEAKQFIKENNIKTSNLNELYNKQNNLYKEKENLYMDLELVNLKLKNHNKIRRNIEDIIR